MCTLGDLLVALRNGEIELLAGHALVNISDIPAGGLEVASSIESSRDIDLAGGSVILGGIGIGYNHKLFDDVSEQLKTRFALLLGVAGFHCGTNHSKEHTSGNDHVRGRDSGNINIYQIEIVNLPWKLNNNDSA